MCKKYKVTKEHKQKIIQAGTEEQPYYTNSSQLPVNFTDDVFEALDLQDDLQCKYTGGCVEKGNLVLTSKGYIPIEEIVSNFNKEEGLKVLSFNKETGKSEWDTIVDAMAIDVSKHDKIRVVGTNKVNIVTSDWHPFFVINGDEIIEKRADELKIGDKLLQSSTFEADEKIENVFSEVITTVKADVEDNQFYDLTTEKNHNYLCGKNGFVFIHNTVFHVYMNEALPDITSCKNLVRKILTNYRMPYISITPTICYCPKHGYLEGYHDYCPFCDKELMNNHTDEIDVGL